MNVTLFIALIICVILSCISKDDIALKIIRGLLITIVFLLLVNLHREQIMEPMLHIGDEVIYQQNFGTVGSIYYEINDTLIGIGEIEKR